MIIDIDADSNFSLSKIAEQLNNLRCIALELRSFSKLHKDTLVNHLSCFNSSTLRYVSLIICYDSYVDNNYLTKIIKFFPRVQNIIVSSSNKSSTTVIKDVLIKYITDNYNSSACCGVISKNYFTININSFLEAFSFNSCLNRKISIDTEGNIKNCPSMAKSYGNIKDTTLQQALDHPDFKKVWSINKDKVKVYQDCEFRYICTDCRAYVEDPKDDYSKPLKCGYDPYSGTWEEWSTNPLKQEAIFNYGIFN